MRDFVKRFGLCEQLAESQYYLLEVAIAGELVEE